MGTRIGSSLIIVAMGSLGHFLGTFGALKGPLIASTVRAVSY